MSTTRQAMDRTPRLFRRPASAGWPTMARSTWAASRASTLTGLAWTTVARRSAGARRYIQGWADGESVVTTSRSAAPSMITVALWAYHRSAIRRAGAALAGKATSARTTKSQRLINPSSRETARAPVQGRST